MNFLAGTQVIVSNSKNSIAFLIEGAYLAKTRLTCQYIMEVRWLRA